MTKPDLASSQNEFRFLIKFSILFYLLLIVIHPHGGFMPDINYWQDWAIVSLQKGMGNIYNGTDVNYNPGFLYALNLFAKINGTAEEITRNIHSLRLIVVFFDFAGVFLAAWVLKKNGMSLLPAIFVLLNAAYLYNTMAWGQVDAVHTFFACASIIAAANRRAVLSVILLIISLYVKLQGIIFIPIVGILLLPQFISRPKNILYGLIAFFAVQFILLFPFIQAGQLGRLWEVNLNSVGFFPVVSMNAFNMWHLLVEGDLMQVPDSIPFMGISYKNWGFILFIITSGLVLFPLLIRVLNLHFQNESLSQKDIGIICLTTALVTLNFFYFNTEMHERYSHPAVLFIAIYALLTKDNFIYFIISLAYFLNMEKVLHFLSLNNYTTFIFDTKFISALFLLAIILGFFRIYTSIKIGAEIKLIFNNLLPRKHNSQAV